MIACIMQSEPTFNDCLYYAERAHFQCNQEKGQRGCCGSYQGEGALIAAMIRTLSLNTADPGEDNREYGIDSDTAPAPDCGTERTCTAHLGRSALHPNMEDTVSVRTIPQALVGTWSEHSVIRDIDLDFKPSLTSRLSLLIVTLNWSALTLLVVTSN